MKKSLFGLVALLLAAIVFTGCPTDADDDEQEDTRKELTAGAAVSAAASDTSKAITFTGATGLTLTKDDFAVSSGGTVTGVSVTSGTATVTVTFAANTETTAKTYTVAIAPDSAKIKGSATVAITQAAAAAPDTRKELTAGAAVSAAATDTSKAVTFTGATGLTLTKDDFAVTTGGTISTVNVVSGTATVTITFTANTSITSAKTYTVSIASSSTKIKGAATVAITQAAATGSAGITAIPPAIPGDALIDLTGPVTPVLWLNGTITASVKYGSITKINWYLDSVQIAGQTSATLTVNARNYSLGTHTLTVIATKTSDGQSYSKTVNFAIVEE